MPGRNERRTSKPRRRNGSARRSGTDAQPQPVEAPPPEVLPAQAAEDRSAFAFLKVFRHRNYRLFFSGQLVSLMGTWITNVTQGWLVYSLTHSPLLLGVVSFAGQVPVFFFSAFGGMISDRFDRRRMLLITQSLACAESAALAVLTLTHWFRYGWWRRLALFQGFVNAFDVPIRQAMTVEMVGKEDLRHAISLNSMMFNLARVVGPPHGRHPDRAGGHRHLFFARCLVLWRGDCQPDFDAFPAPPGAQARRALARRRARALSMSGVHAKSASRLFLIACLLGLRRVLSHPAARLRARYAASGQRRAGLSLWRGGGGGADGRLCPGAGAGPASAGDAGGGGAELRPVADRLFSQSHCLSGCRWRC